VGSALAGQVGDARDSSLRQHHPRAACDLAGGEGRRLDEVGHVDAGLDAADGSTAASVGGTSRVTTVCGRTTIIAARTTGPGRRGA
jgi:hypothetical protein